MQSPSCLLFLLCNPSIHAIYIQLDFSFSCRASCYALVHIAVVAMVISKLAIISQRRYQA